MRAVGSEINQAIESAYRIEREHGILCNQQSRMGATFAAVCRLAETDDMAAIDSCPDWLLRELPECVQSFCQTGEFGFVSNLGAVDHSSPMAKASSVLATFEAQPFAARGGCALSSKTY